MIAPLAEPGFYASHRPYVTVAALCDLAGLETGRVHLPHRLDWSPGGRTYDLSDPEDRRWLYIRVLREATSAADITHYWHPRLLRELWASLVLPGRLREAWEHRFPELATQRELTVP